jgi:hypothetical protein
MCHNECVRRIIVWTRYVTLLAATSVLALGVVFVARAANASHPKLDARLAAAR